MKIRITIDFASRVVEIGEDGLEGLEGEPRQALLEEIIHDEMLNTLEWDWEEVK